ncbi:MAG: hypothetical protein ACYTGC_12445, partial [Planctomycetota bacterium]
DPDADTDTDTDADPDPDADPDADTDTDTDADTDTVADADTDTDADAGTDTDAAAGAGTDTERGRGRGHAPKGSAVSSSVLVESVRRRCPMRTRLEPIIVLASSLLAVGCIEREESITVEPDGTVHMELSFSADSFDELYLGDAVPAIDRGWLVETWVDRDDDGQETFKLTAEQSFAPEEALPGDYAGRKDALADVVLKFPTGLTVEERRDGIYYHFRRVYAPRDWAYLQTPREQLLEQVEVLEGRDFELLSPSERRTLLESLVRFELTKFEVFARRAFLDASPTAPQSVWLAVRAALQPLVTTLEYERLAELVLVMDEDPIAAQQLEAEREAFEESAVVAMRAALAESGEYDGSSMAYFLQRFRQHRKAFEITEELEDDGFRISVTMPGTIVGHNGESASGTTVTWEFGGASFRDRELELMVSSRMER